ncbi:B12-binding domain-containing radical SAM protein [Beijerinckia indica]|uniref:Radical SAM domain protein n=1 Tax=Beijerinckia indica subsp. indica (strain ATCC 9039 / DSM 1715 / NCIMB 8712) TaxID=395963 RepID=B2IKP3_BEII9|nr:B12-binding domain-containing radical SAM protein [Beijerinckia indica]ACB95082.1 Radical SAM domain protein [Beijerinckia indica subsp. indica ATCC 9039]
MTRFSAPGQRHILCVFPRYVPSFGTFEYAYELTDGVKAFMPPQGLLVIASVMPANWDVRFIDENMQAASTEDFLWADVVFVSGMHIQRRQIEDIRRRAHAQGKVVVLGGPSVSACPHYYPAFDYLHVGELGDATEKLVAILAKDISRPEQQVVLKTETRRDLADFPVPAYELAPIDRYFLGSIQFSSGCPYTCEFCDIPGLYGRVARLKTAEQILTELDVLLARGVVGSIYFVDDNLVANRHALKELLPHLIAWQKRNGYPLAFACEATLNIARSPDILALMREAAFETIFCGIETPEPQALKAISKQHNMALPILEAIDTINHHGMEVVSGIILGLDTDTLETGGNLLAFVERSHIPLLTINLLQALPGTPLWDRLEKENRLCENDDLESNVIFKLPYDDVLSMWRDCMGKAYQPKILFDRYRHQMRHTYPNKLPRPWSRQRLSPRNIRKGIHFLSKIIWKVGIRGDYKAAFWSFVLFSLSRGKVEPIIRVGLVAHHLIAFARDACAGKNNASHYSAKARTLELEGQIGS